MYYDYYMRAKIHNFPIIYTICRSIFGNDKENAYFRA